MRPSFRRWAVLFALVAAIALLVALTISQFVHERNEGSLCEQWLREHQHRIWDDSVASIAYDRRASSRVTFKADRNVGVHTFRINKPTSSFHVRVIWETTKDGDSFKVLKVERIENGSAPTVLWPRTSSAGPQHRDHHGRPAAMHRKTTGPMSLFSGRTPLVQEQRTDAKEREPRSRKTRVLMRPRGVDESLR